MKFIHFVLVNIQSYILGQDETFKKPRLTKRFNLFKRLESSVYSFEETLKRMLERIDQQLRVTRLMIDSFDMKKVENKSVKFPNIKL